MKNVIACIDGMGVHATSVCDLASWAGETLELPITLLHVLDKEQYPVEPDMAGTIGLGSREALLEELAVLDEQRARIAREQGKIMLNAAEERIQQSTETALTVCQRQRHGDFVATLKELEDEMRLLIIGRQSNSGQRLGAHLESAIRVVDRPILVAQEHSVKPKRFLFAYDASPTAKRVIDLIALSGLLHDIPCELVMVGANTNDQQAQLQEAANILSNAGLQVNARILAGDVVDTLLTAVEESGSDLVVMGAYGHSRIRHFLVGSTTTQILRQVKVPLLLLR